MAQSNPIEEITLEIQQECHATVEGIINASDKPVSVQDATNVFLYKKLAELELRIMNLEQGNYLTTPLM